MKHHLCIINLKYLVLLIFICLCISVSKAQQYYFENYTVIDGLPQSKVYSLLQDDDGYIWLGTESGVSKWDGRKFVNYTSKNGIGESGVRVIHKDSEKRLWFGHNGGDLTYFEDNKFHVCKNDSIVVASDITSFVEDNNGFMWISTHGSGVVSIRKTDLLRGNYSCKKYAGKQGLSDRVFGITKTVDGKIFFVTDVGVKYFDATDSVFQFYRPEGLSRFFTTTCMYEDSYGNYWFGTHNGGLYKLIKGSQEFKIYDKRDGLANNFISTIFESDDKSIWVGTWGGGVTRIFNGNIVVYNSENGFTGAKIQCFAQDSEGNILIGTHENGVNVFKGDHFTYFNEENNLPGQQVLSVVESSNKKMWVGTNHGLANLSLINKNKYFVEKVTDIGNFSSDQIKFIVQDKDDYLWIGTGQYGIVRINPETLAVFRNETIDRIVASNHQVITAMVYEEKNHTLWIGTLGGLISYDISQQKAYFITQSAGLSANEISALYLDKQNILWIGSRENGITVFSQGEFKILDSKASYTPTCFITGKEGDLWVGTLGKGVFIIKDSSVYKHYSDKDGILSNYITLLNTDNDGNIYIGTSRGLIKYNHIDSTFRTYNEKDGFIGIEVKDNATCIDLDGNMWFGTAQGLIKYFPEKDLPQNVEPFTHIEHLEVNLKNRQLISPLILDYSEKSIAFDYSSISLSNPDAILYQVKLEGADEDWRPATKQTNVTYSPLPPGKYTFMVKARNKVGIWNKQPATFSFKIDPPFWQTWWFYVTVSAIIIALIIIYIKIRERNLKKENKILEDKVRERTAEVVQKNDELERKNKDITDSIRYAKRIQEAVLPAAGTIQDLIEDSFIFYKPRDIVSGDFYWLSRRNGQIVITAADCTGHGVPGAFMSMLGISFLNEIVNNQNILQANQVLNELRQYVITSLKQQGKRGESQDGMDISLCIIDQKEKTIQYSGAYNPLYQIRDNSLTIYKADRMPVGYYFKETREFTNHIVHFQPGDAFYLFSDGFVDQFGGEMNKKFNSKQYKILLTQIADKPMVEQHKILDKTLREWKGSRDQLDDVLIIGFKM